MMRLLQAQWKILPQKKTHSSIFAWPSWVKGQIAKIHVPRTEIIKDYNSGMDGVDLLDQKTAGYKLDRKPSDGRY